MRGGLIAGRTVAEWQSFARRDDCLEMMVPSDLREIVGAIMEGIFMEGVQAHRIAELRDVEAAAIRMWQHEARNTPVGKRRTPDAWLSESDDMRARWRGFARAALAQEPGE